MSELGSKTEVSARRIDICWPLMSGHRQAPVEECHHRNSVDFPITPSVHRSLLFGLDALLQKHARVAKISVSGSQGYADPCRHQLSRIGPCWSAGSRNEVSIAGPFMANLHSGDSPVLSAAIAFGLDLFFVRISRKFVTPRRATFILAPAHPAVARSAVGVPLI